MVYAAMYYASDATVKMDITHSYSEKKYFVSFGREKMEKFWTIRKIWSIHTV